MATLSTPAILSRVALMVLAIPALTPVSVSAGQPAAPPACETTARVILDRPLESHRDYRWHSGRRERD